jgi:hypothetical protein
MKALGADEEYCASFNVSRFGSEAVKAEFTPEKSPPESFPPLDPIVLLVSVESKLDSRLVPVGVCGDPEYHT